MHQEALPERRNERVGCAGHDSPFAISLFSPYDSAEGMKAGNYGNLLVLIEQPRGEYAVTIAFLRLVTTLVKVTHPVTHPEMSCVSVN